MINARAESLAEKSTLKRLLSSREWRKEGKGKVAMLFKLKSGEPFVLAGLWDAWRKPDGETLRSYTIVTTEPNEVLASVHNRMPVMLSDSNALDWLCGSEIDHAISLLKPFSADLIDAYDVSKIVNSPLNDSPECIAAI